VASSLLRIISDLHLGDERSWVQDPAALAPLLAGIDALVLNGDCCDTQTATGRNAPDAVRRFFAERVPQVTFLTGNHDPDVSETDELSLAGGRVWVTHGDVLFDDIAPWSRLQPILARRLAQIRGRHPPADWERIPTRIRMMREACLRLPPEEVSHTKGLRAQLHRMAFDLFPPRRALAMLRVWRAAPRLAADLAAAQRPDARFIVLGHIHFPRVWRRPDGRVIINTGSFAPPLGGLFVDLTADSLTVRKIARRAGLFHPGAVVAAFPLV
jgi:predicted phosphodiesterase